MSTQAEVIEADKEICNLVKKNEKKIIMHTILSISLAVFICYLFVAALSAVTDPYDVVDLRKEKQKYQDELETAKKRADFEKHTNESYENDKPTYIYKNKVASLEKEISETDTKLSLAKEKSSVKFLLISGVFLIILFCFIIYFMQRLNKAYSTDTIYISFGKCIGKEKEYFTRSPIRYYYCVIKFPNGNTDKKQIPELCYENIDYEDEVFIVMNKKHFGSMSRIYTLPS